MKYDKNLKKYAMERMLGGGSAAEISRSMNIGKNTVYQWRQELHQRGTVLLDRVINDLLSQEELSLSMREKLARDIDASRKFLEI